MANSFAFRTESLLQKKLALDLFPEFDHLIDVLASVGITHLHHLAMASSSLASVIGLSEADLSELVGMAQAMLRGLAR